VIELRHVTKSYGAREALAQVTVSIAAGQIALLVGPNGAGKSTLLRCVLGITDFDGALQVQGRDPRADSAAVRAAIGYMPQTGGLQADLTVRDTMAFFADLRGVPHARIDVLLTDAGLMVHADKQVGELSGGLRQRLGFAIALLSDPQILVLDEPSASLDASSRAWLAARVRALADAGRAVLISTHGGSELRDVADRCISLDEGRVVADETCGVSRRAATLAPGGPATASASASVVPLARKELRDALRNRWLIGYAVLTGVLGMAATATALDSTSGLALQAFGRTTATLMNLCLLLAPLVAVLMGAALIAGEQERGTLEHLLAQPLSRTRLLLGKYVGLLVALTLATLLGFAPAAVMIAAAAGISLLGSFALFPAIAACTAAALAGIGLLISVSSRTATQAQGSAVLVWFGCVLLYDLVLMGVVASAGLPAPAFAALLVANPIDAARVLGVLTLEPDLHLLGPAGAYLTSTLTPIGAALALCGVLAGWAVAPVALAAWQFSRPVRNRRRGNEETGDPAVVGSRDAGSGDCLPVRRRPANS
jgi:ABC-type multidrug transport system ATPase subunit/ABC-type transport system involved in multi-copper enzyme maturation permease subunit